MSSTDRNSRPSRFSGARHGDVVIVGCGGQLPHDSGGPSGPVVAGTATNAGQAVQDGGQVRSLDRFRALIPVGAA